MPQAIFIILSAFLLFSPAPHHYIRTARMKQLARKYNLDFVSNYSKIGILISLAPFFRKKVNVISGSLNDFKVQVNDTIVPTFFVNKKETEFYLNGIEKNYDKGINFFRSVLIIDQWLNSVKTGNPIDLSQNADRKRTRYYSFVIIIIILLVLFYFSLPRRF